MKYLLGDGTRTHDSGRQKPGYWSGVGDVSGRECDACVSEVEDLSFL